MPEIDRREDLLEQAIAWVQARGLGGLALRPLAHDCGTSTRTLIQHFDGKDGLITAILERVVTQWMEHVEARLSHAYPVADALESLWVELRAPSSRGLHALAFEAWGTGLATQDPAYEEFLRRAVAGWTSLIERGLTADGVRSPRRRAVLVVASIEGLLLHQLTDPELPIDEAFCDLMAWVRQCSPRPVNVSAPYGERRSGLA